MKWYEAIKAKREEMGLSQSELARQSGVSQALINKIERGGVEQSKYIKQIANVLGISDREFALDLATDSVLAARQGLIEFRDLPNEIPIYHTRIGSEESLFIPIFESPDLINRPHELRANPGAHGFYVPSDIMSPEFEEGDIIVIHSMLPIITGSTVVMQRAADGPEGRKESMLCRVVGWTHDTWLVRQWNNPAQQEPQTLVRSEWVGAARVALRSLRR